MSAPLHEHAPRPFLCVGRTLSLRNATLAKLGDSEVRAMGNEVKGITAWLITMVPGEREEIIAVINYRRSSSYVGKVMEHEYVARRQGLVSLLEYIKTGSARCPYRLSIVDGIPWAEELWCGSGDRVYWARKVKNLHVEVDASGQERLRWTEQKRPDFKGVAKELSIDVQRGSS